VVPIVRERKGREEHDDLRPSVLALAVDGHRAPAGTNTMAGGQVPIGVVAELATRPRGVRPIELVRGLVAASGGAAGEGSQGAAPDRGTAPGTPVLDRACRTQQWIEREGIREEPLRRRGEPTGTHRAAHALERAS
jgi:hypothetical protein